MYSTCLFCRARFLRNEVLEAFPEGRRIAFDLAKGRLWVICHRCDRWSLAPLDERFEIVHLCEERFRGAAAITAARAILPWTNRAGGSPRQVADAVKLLERAWRDAEEVAEIADNLLVPPFVEAWLRRHRANATAGG